MQARFQLFADKRDAVRAGGCVLELRGSAGNLLCADKHGALALDVAEVLVLEFQRLNRFVDAPQRFEAGIETAEVAPRWDGAFGELIPGKDVRVALTHVGQNVVDVVAEYRVRCDKEHLAWVKAFALLIEQVRNAL